MARGSRHRGLYYRKFNKGLTGWGKWSADDHIALLQQLAFVVGTGTKVLRVSSSSVRVAYIQAVDQLMIILHILHKREVSEMDLTILHGAAKQIGQLLQKSCEGLPAEFRSKITLNRPKVHALLHLRYKPIFSTLLFVVLTSANLGTPSGGTEVP